MRTKRERTNYPGIQSYVDGSGNRRFAVRYRTADGRQTDRCGFTKLSDARAYQASAKADIARGTFVPHRAGRVTLRELWPAYSSHKQATLRPGSYVHIERAWRLYVEPSWGDYPVGKLTRSGLQSWTDELSRRLSATPVLDAMQVVRDLLAIAVQDGLLVTSPATYVRTPRARRVETKRYLTLDEVSAVTSCLHGQERTAFLTMVSTGLRWGELAALQVDAVDLTRGRLHVRRSVSRIAGGWVVQPPKSGKARSVPLPATLAPLLAEQMAGRANDALVFPSRSGGYWPAPQHTIRESNKKRSAWLFRACDSAGVAYVSPHGLRHTCASLAVNSGASVLALANMLGHEDPSITLRKYADLFDEGQDELAQRMSGLITFT